MKQKLILLLLTLICSVGAWAIDVKIANTSSGLPTTADFGTFSGQVFTTAEGSGLAGVTVTAESGVTIGEQVVNVASYGNCFKLVTSAAATSYKITLAAPDGYVITGYSLGCSANTFRAVHTLTSEDGSVSIVANAPNQQGNAPKPFNVTDLNAQSTYFTISTANQGNTLYIPTFTITVVKEGAVLVNVTYDLYESDGTTKVTSVVVQQEAGSDLAIPDAILSNTYFNYTTEGTIGDGDCTIKVTRTPKNGIVYPISNLTNNKAYKIKVPRGTYTVNNGLLANTVKNSSYPINYFALISYEGNYYMWSLEAGKFVAGNEANLTDTPVAVTFNASTAPSFLIKSGANTLNATSGFATGGGFDNWSTADEGNQCVFYEVADFNPSEVLAALDAHFHPTTYVIFEISDASGVVYTTEQVAAAAGDIVSELPNEYKSPYCTYEVTPTTVVAGENIVRVTVTYGDMPFKASSDYANAEWYTLHNASRSYYPYYNSADESYIPLMGGATIEDRFLWAFIGNPIAGFKIVNKAAGVGKYLSASAVGNGQIITMGTEPAIFNVVEGTAANNCGFAINGSYLNDYAGNGKLSFWQQGPTQDTGSRWIIGSLSTDVINLVLNVTGETEAENTRAGKVTVTLNGASTSTYLYGTDTEAKAYVGYTPSEFSATVTSYRGYEFTGFSVDGVDYGTSIEAGELAAVPAGSTLVANFAASTGNGLNLWYDYADDGSASYRIPAIIRTQSGRLIAFSDYRPGHRDVGQGATSIERRYSDDNGATWSPVLRIAEGQWGVNKENVIEWSFGDAAVVADNTPGNSGNDVLMVCCGGNMSWPSSVYNPDLSQNQQGCVRWRSADGGETWSNYEYIMPDIMQALVDAGLRAADGSSGIVRAFFTSGKITQSVRKAVGAKYNRIYCAVDVPDQDVVLYSDDFGETWKVLGNQIANQGDEAHVVEFPDGDLLLVGRGGSSRWVNVFNYSDFDTATGQWGATGQWNNAVATSCNGDVEVIEAYDAYGEKNTVVVETAPMYSSQRRDVQYYFIALPKATGFSVTDFSTVGGASWTQGMNVTHNWSAYSSLLNNGDGTVDILLEESAKDETTGPSGYNIVYLQNQSIKDITNKQYFFNKEEAEAEGVKTPRPGHFYRFKGSASNYYLTPGTTAENSLSTTDALDATTIWYYSNDGLVSYSTGLYLDGNAKGMAPVGTSYKAAVAPSTYHEGKYTIYTNGRYSYDRETNHSIDRGSSLNNDVRYAWTVEEVTSLPVTVGELGLVAIYSPVGLTAPEGVEVYAATKDEANDDNILFGQVDAVKAGTGILVQAAEGTYDFTIESNEADYESDLVGSVATVAKSSIAATVYTLQDGPTFKQIADENVAGFTSYITSQNAGFEAFSITIGDDATGLAEIENGKLKVESSIFNVAGQRMSKAQKGVNIINGKKFLK